MKRCPECNRGYGDELFYCLTDGCYLSPVREPEQTLPAPPPTLEVFQLTVEPPSLPPKEEKKPGSTKRLVTVALLLLGAFIGIVAVNMSSPPTQTTASSSSTPLQTKAVSTSSPIPSLAPFPSPSPSPSLTPKSEQIINEIFELREAWHKPVLVYVPPIASNARITGAFTASGVGINFLIMSKSEYDRMSETVRKLVQMPALYKLSEIRSAKVNQPINPGAYYLVFDNDVTPGNGFQTVAAEFYLKYERP